MDRELGRAKYFEDKVIVEGLLTAVSSLIEDGTVDPDVFMARFSPALKEGARSRAANEVASELNLDSEARFSAELNGDDRVRRALTRARIGVKRG